MLISPDASDLCRGNFVTRVPGGEMDRDVAMCEMSHETLIYLSGTSRESQLRWATVDKGGHTIVSTFRSLSIFCEVECVHVCRPSQSRLCFRSSCVHGVSFEDRLPSPWEIDNSLVTVGFGKWGA